MPHLSLHPTLSTCSSETILRGISELTTSNTTYTSDTGKKYDFNTVAKQNNLLVKALINTGLLVAICCFFFPLLEAVMFQFCFYSEQTTSKKQHYTHYLT